MCGLAKESVPLGMDFEVLKADSRLSVFVSLPIDQAAILSYC